ncbi:DUF2225 domain-containing protein [Anaerobacillus sp. MEB173]|uniref:DUF2225 domain-containing protein n=1 Tax=Anaerobacillus sp. MEB173 TaxID=3383345 RepID=UPI003F92FA65
MTKEVHPYYDKSIRCQACNETYTTKRLRSRFVKVEKIDTDFFTVYKDGRYNPLFYEVCVCPHCGYSFAETFSNKFPSGTLDRIKSQISGNWKTQDFGGVRNIDEAISTYKLGILSGKLKDEKSIVIAGLCLRLAWLYRMKENEEQERRFLRFAVKEYEQANLLSEYIGTTLSEMKIFYLIGELYRRLKNYETSIQFFSKVISHKNRALEPKTVEMAREQWYMTREEGKKEIV